MDMASKYPLPAFLEGRCTPSHYYKWLHQKADYYDALEFEICSWQINDCKADLLPEEFVKMCGKVIEYRGE